MEVGFYTTMAMNRRLNILFLNDVGLTKKPGILTVYDMLKNKKFYSFVWSDKRHCNHCGIVGGDYFFEIIKDGKIYQRENICRYCYNLRGAAYKRKCRKLKSQSQQ